MLQEVSGRHTDECDECHHDRPGRWYQDDRTGVEWFLCEECHASTLRECAPVGAFEGGGS